MKSSIQKYTLISSLVLGACCFSACDKDFEEINSNPEAVSTVTPLPAFYGEARRVAKPGALLALISYGVLALEPDVMPAMADFRAGIAGDWPPERQLVEEGYRRLDFPFAELPTPTFAIEVAWSLEALLGYVSTWSAVSRLRARGGEGELDMLAERLAATWGDPARSRPVRFPIALKVARLT